MTVPEAQLKDDGAGLVPASTGWCVLNARDARWFHRPGRGDNLPLTGSDEFEAETNFPMLGMSIQVLPPGERNSTYHWETEQENFLVLAGEAMLIVEGQERYKQWDCVLRLPDGVRLDKAEPLRARGVRGRAEVETGQGRTPER